MVMALGSCGTCLLNFNLHLHRVLLQPVAGLEGRQRIPSLLLADEARQSNMNALVLRCTAGPESRCKGPQTPY